MKKIEILGTGCPKCKKLFESTQQIVRELNLDAEVLKVEDLNKILEYGIMMTPALVVDGQIKVAGRLPKTDELKAMLK